ncbi:MAG: ribonuclease III [Tidjanibacter sp.]|nr:ribonuclease III [Tidjanibacter sp.]
MRFVARIAHLLWGADREYYRAFRRIFGVTPDNVELYKLALVHRSASVKVEGGGSINNERLEYLGDAVLESIVSDYLFIEYPDKSEGFLTQTRSKIVSRQSLNSLARKLGLDEMVIYNSTGNFAHKHLFGDCLEAMIGALYLDKGYNVVNRIVINDLLSRHIDLEDLTHSESDHKSRLIEWCQKSKRTISFSTEADGEQKGSQPAFLSRVLIDDMRIGVGRGSTKKEAEQRAAENAWVLLGDEMGDFILDRYDHLKDESCER